MHTIINIKALLIIHFEAILSINKQQVWINTLSVKTPGFYGVSWARTHTKWLLTEVKEGTGLDDKELASAIGWLAREDKIQFELQHLNGKDKTAYVYLMLNVYF